MTMLALHHGGPIAPPVRKYTGHETAEAVGLSWERFRKVRVPWPRDRDFPERARARGARRPPRAGRSALSAIKGN